MSRGATYDRVYAALKHKLLTGAFRAGSPLEPAALADELNASITPVRDALHRLAGEHLVDTLRHDGFWTPIVTEAGLRNLYEWCLQILTLALRAGTGTSSGKPADVADPEPAEHAVPEATARLFSRIAQLSPNPEHGRAMRSVNDRLSLARQLEPQFLSSGLDMLHAVEGALSAGDLGCVRRHLIVYHRERRRIVPALAGALMAGHLGLG